jgi:hypothetical protein
LKENNKTLFGRSLLDSIDPLFQGNRLGWLAFCWIKQAVAQTPKDAAQFLFGFETFCSNKLMHHKALW